MECNREEALRAKAIAEEKIENNDFIGAKKLALKAKVLYPGVDGITQILTIVDVYISAENKISGETDWYGVLNVSPSADDETIRKQYRKLALMLHPDKNKSASADGAFKLISEAWSLLSDKPKRLAYNLRRGSGSGGFQNKAKKRTGGPSSGPPKANGFFNIGNKTNASKPQFPTQSSFKSNQRRDTFWTVCRRCKMHYEYLKVYLNHTLLCPNCNEAFVANETAPPSNFSKSSNEAPPNQQQHAPPSNHAHTTPPGRTNAFDPMKKFPAAQRLGPPGTNSSHIQQLQEKAKRGCNEMRGPTEWDEFNKKTNCDDSNSIRPGANCNNAPSVPTSGSALGSKCSEFPSINRCSNLNRDLTAVETRTVLITKARKDILELLKSFDAEAKPADERKVATKKNMRKRQEETPDHDKTGFAVGSTAPSMCVLDADFYDFDQDRSEHSFGDNEVWATYDGDDGMPRFYALVSRVISRSPFKLRISWLNSKTTSEFGSLDWVGSGFYKTCGEFRVGRYETCKSINSFSGRVSWSKGLRGSIVILPQKGDVWALYRNWSPDWDQNTPYEVIHKYEMVTVVDDYDEEKGVSVISLAKVSGFKTVFRPDSGLESVWRICRDEMFRFSHRVPHHLLSELGGENAPKGCLELDPAATPSELLVTTGEIMNDV